MDCENLKATRQSYGEKLAELGEKNKDIIVLDADLSAATKTSIFAKKFPERFFDMGIAEQDMIATAAGLASQGKIAFASTFAMFATGRTYDQIRNSAVYGNFNVKIVATHGGITVGEDGASHQALEDVSLMRGLPHMSVIVPADCKECDEVIKYAAGHDGPMYIRIARTNVPDIFDENYKFDFNKAVVLKKGSNVTIITNGETLAEVLECADILEKQGITATVIHMPVVKPLDSATILDETKNSKLVVTVENHSIIGGVGSAICELLSEKMPKQVYRIGINDEFGQSGEQRLLMEFYGLTSEKIAEKIMGKLREIK